MSAFRKKSGSRRREVVTMDIEMLIVEYTELLAVYDAFVREKVDNPY